MEFVSFKDLGLHPLIMTIYMLLQTGASSTVNFSPEDN